MNPDERYEGTTTHGDLKDLLREYDEVVVEMKAGSFGHLSSRDVESSVAASYEDDLEAVVDDNKVLEDYTDPIVTLGGATHYEDESQLDAHVEVITQAGIVSNNNAYRLTVVIDDEDAEQLVDDWDLEPQ